MSWVLNFLFASLCFIKSLISTFSCILLLLFPEGSLHSSDSLSDSSPPAPGVPTQVVQPVQSTPQVRPKCLHKPSVISSLWRKQKMMITNKLWLFRQRSVLQAVSQAVKRSQTDHINNLHINQEVNSELRSRRAGEWNNYARISLGFL